MRNALLNGLSFALYRSLVLALETADAAGRIRGRRDQVRIGWR